MPKLVYIAHQMSGEMEKNIAEVYRILEENHTEDIIPIAPYLVAFNYLDDSKPEERLKGMKANAELFKRRLFDELWLCGPKLSSGMREEVFLALDYGIKIKCFNEGLQESLEKVIEEHENGRITYHV